MFVGLRKTNEKEKNETKQNILNLIGWYCQVPFAFKWIMEDKSVDIGWTRTEALVDKYSFQPNYYLT